MQVIRRPAFLALLVLAIVAALQPGLPAQTTIYVGCSRTQVEIRDRPDERSRPHASP